MKKTIRERRGFIKKRAPLALAVLLLFLCACGDKGPSFSAASTPVQSSSLPGQEEQSLPQSSSLAQSTAALDALVLPPGTNALTGQPRAGDMLQGQRPLAIVISNSARARPQRGLARADVIVEMLASGNVTHLLAMYDDYRGLSTTGPVSETYDQFVQFAMPLAAVQVHTGASPYARNLLLATATKDIDGVTLGTTAFGFDTNRTLPRPGGKLNQYCWFTDSALLWEGMVARDIVTVGELQPLFRFAQNTAAPLHDAYQISATFSNEAQAGFAFDAVSGLYIKYIGPDLHTDEDGAQLAFTNVLMLRINVGLKADSDQYLEYDYSSGDGYYFTAGGAQHVTWTKGAPKDALRILDSTGNELNVTPGKSYIGFLPANLAGSLGWSGQDGAAHSPV